MPILDFIDCAPNFSIFFYMNTYYYFEIFDRELTFEDIANHNILSEASRYYLKPHLKYWKKSP